MRKWFVILVLVIGMVLAQTTLAYPIQTPNDCARWLCMKGDSSLSSHCNKTIHFPYSVSWDASVSQAHGVLADGEYFAIIRATEVLVYQDNANDALYSIDVDGSCLPCIYKSDIYTVRGNEIIGSKLSNGTLVHSIKMSHGTPKYMLPAEDFLLVITNNGVLLKIQDGQVTMKHTLPDTVTTSPVINNGSIAIACDDYYVHLYNFDLKQIATSSTVGEIIDMVTVNDGCIVVIRESGGAIALDPVTAKQLWNNKYPEGRNLHAVSDGRRVFLLGADSGIACIRPDGRTAWVNRTTSPSYSGISGRLLLVATRDGFLCPIQTSTGQAGTPYQTPGNLTEMPTILADRVYLICGPRILRLTTSKYGVYLGFECDLDFDRLCPNRIYTRPMTIKNITDKKLSVRIYCKTPNTIVSNDTFIIKQNQELSLNVFVNTMGIYKQYTRGELIIDTPAYRYRIGIQYRIEQIPGDCNLDCIVDRNDIFIVGTCLGKRSYHKGYMKECDFDKNGIIDILDANVVLEHFGESWEIETAWISTKQ